MNLSSREIEAILKKHGFSFLRQKGSHRHFIGFTHGKKRRVTVIANQKGFAMGTFKSIVRQSGLSEKEFLPL
jgi:predicted RNA binding protein YcfA (HicA-like mRNA interferase family)